MKKSILGIALALLALAPASTQALSLENAVSIDITVYTQVQAVDRGNLEVKRTGRARITNREVIAALSAATQVDLTGGRLLLIRDDFGNTNSTGNPRFVVRKGTNDTDVSSYFNAQDSNDVEASVFQIPRNAFLDFTRTGVFSLNFSAANLAFALSGLGTESGRTVRHGTGDNAVSGETSVFRANLAGTATRSDVTNPAQGTVATSPGVIR